jgi:hypothetical protein
MVTEPDTEPGLLDDAEMASPDPLPLPELQAVRIVRDPMAASAAA